MAGSITWHTKANWLNPNISLLLDTDIVEWDATDAGMSIIKHNGLLSEKKIARLEQLEKQAKNVAVGKLRASDAELSKAMSEGLRHAVASFIEQSNLEKQDVLSIKNDADCIILYR